MSVWGQVAGAIAGPAIGFLSDRYGQKKAINHQTGEREAAEAFSAQQAAEQRAWASNQASVDRRFQRLEHEKARSFTASEAELARLFNREEAALARAFSSDEAKAAREFSAQEALLNREFQEMMASTQFSRATEDLKRAGLNRILALGQPAAAASGSAAQAVAAQTAQASGPAASGSAPSGRSVSGASASSSGGSTSSPSYGATQAAMLRNVIDWQTAQSVIQKQKAETELIKTQTEKTKADTDIQELKGSISAIIKETIGGEGSTGQQIYQAVKPMADKLINLDRQLQRYLQKGEDKIQEKIRDVRDWWNRKDEFERR